MKTTLSEELEKIWGTSPCLRRAIAHHDLQRRLWLALRYVLRLQYGMCALVAASLMPNLGYLGLPFGHFLGLQACLLVSDFERKP